MNLFTPIKIKNIKIKNRIVLPPMVRFSILSNDGYVNDELVNYYEELAEVGNGLIIVEATCVAPDGKLRDNQLEIWDDKFIPGLQRVANICRKHGVPSILQIHHVGFKERIVEPKTEVIDAILDQFEQGIKRARLAGFDGVELHGCHRYFLNQLSSKKWNLRTDKYGGSLKNRLSFVRELIKRTKDLFDDNFLLSYRMGGNDPDLESGVEIAKELESYGVDILNVSFGIPEDGIRSHEKIKKPKEFLLNWVVYLAVIIKKNVNIPVIGCTFIKEEDQADYLISNGLTDFAAVGRAQISRPWWVKQAKERFFKRTGIKVE